MQVKSIHFLPPFVTNHHKLHGACNAIFLRYSFVDQRSGAGITGLSRAHTVSRVVFFSGGSREGSVFWSFPASRGRPHSSIGGPLSSKAVTGSVLTLNLSLQFERFLCVYSFL